MTVAYYYVRWRWRDRLILKKAAEEFSQKYEVKMLEMPSSEQELTLKGDDRHELLVKSETLKALLSTFRAILVQKKPAPFTSKDLELRKRVITLYPHERSTPFPWSFTSEPRFETIEEKT